MTHREYSYSLTNDHQQTSSFPENITENASFEKVWVTKSILVGQMRYDLISWKEMG